MKHFFKSIIFCTLLFNINTYLQASSATITASQDSFVRMDQPTTNKNTHYVAVRKVNDGASGKNTKAILQFKYQYGPNLNDVMLMLDMKSFGSSGNQTIKVWGVLDGYTLEDFDETTDTYNDWTSIFNNSGDGTNNHVDRLHNGDPSNTTSAQPLGSFQVNNGNVGQTVTFTSDALLDFVQSDTNGTLTILLTAAYNNGKAVTFASKEDGNYSGPRLFLSADEEIYTPNFDTYIRYQDNSTDYDDSSVIYVKLSGGGTGSTTRIGIMNFSIDKDVVAKSSDLLLDVSSFNNGSNAAFYVWGISDSVLDQANSEGRTWSNWEGIVDGSIDGIDSSWSYIYGNEPLGTFNMSTSDLGGTVSFSSDALNNYINDDTNGKVILLLTRVTDSGALNTSFASSEHSSLQPPRLVVRPELEPNTLTADAEIRMIDVDGDDDEDMVLVVNMPDGGGVISADPYVIADYLIQSGYGVGEGTDYYDSLSGTQQISLSDSINIVINYDCGASLGTPSPVTADDLYNAYDSMSSSREYQMGSFTVSTTIEADIEKGEIALEISMDSCTLVEIKWGNYTATIDGPSAQAALVFTDDRIAFGAEYAYYTYTVSQGTSGGSSASISASAGGGFFVDVSTGNGGLYGASFPISSNASVSLYISADDAKSVFNTMENAFNSAGNSIQDVISDIALENVDIGNATMVSLVDNLQDTTVHVERAATEITIFVEDAGQEALIVIDDVTSTTTQVANDALGSIANASGNAADELVSYANTVSSFISSTWTDVSGWASGTIDNIGKGLKKLFKSLW